MFAAQSTIIVVCLYSHRLTMFYYLTTCICFVLRWQRRIFKLFAELLKIEKLEVAPSYYAECQNFRRVLFLRIANYGLRTSLSIFLAIFEDKRSILDLFSIISNIYCGALVLLPFTLILLSSLMLFKLHCIFNQLFLDSMPTAVRLQKFWHLQRVYGRLNRMIKEINVLFEFPLFISFLHLINLSCMCGYYLIRIFVSALPFQMTTVVPMFGAIDLLNLFLLSSVSQTVEKLQKNIFSQVWDPIANVDLRIERSVDWLALQLTWQNTNVHIMGTYVINMHLAFLIITTILLHVIYLVQADYNFIHIKNSF
ncbi:hypothetical protein KR222_004155 [Zaprionus bogoriensis]|nr:hypothetical protein KR222_004155 [Zaprionus bogoriensis]